MSSIYKYHATGNDFILTKTIPVNPNAFALKVCDRHFGIGADGLIYPSVSEIADIKMNYYNADGTIAPMCGNGIRAFIKFLNDQNMIHENIVKVETLAGIMIVEKIDELYEVNMGKPVVDLQQPDIDGTQKELIEYYLNVNNQVIPSYVFNLGTLHTIVFVDDVNQYDHLANALCHHPFFPNRSNINFVKVVDQKHLEVKTYERGVGWSLSCGTGSSASQYLSYVLNKTKEEVCIDVPGGKLWIKVFNGEVYMKGPATYIAKIEMSGIDENL
ncbi:diaminopimelate epimerase [Mycoplasmatota bacterium]|nr:diaminopimelate epimerase [Mycoplasmatota bacterium]